ncbi:MAG: UDP-2,3-diacylglucosamine diphosphatase [Bacteroidia bacterium]
MSKVFFASDFHLGSPDYQSSLEREKRIVSWLEEIKTDAQSIFLVGDIFDFWYEYNTVVPKYYTRLLGKLAELTDQGIKIYFFKGNHDMWTFDYLSKEIGLVVIDEEWEGEIHGHKLYVHHGDGIGPGDFWYKFIRKVFRSKWAIWLFHRMHPNFGMGLAQYLSKKSRLKNEAKDLKTIPLEKEFQYQFTGELEVLNHRDYYIYGHRHQPRIEKVNETTRFVNLGDWVSHNTFAVLDNNGLELKTYRP